MPTFTGLIHHWISTSGIWEDTGSWDTAEIPVSGDSCIFSGGIYSVQSVTTGPVIGVGYDLDLFYWGILSDYSGLLGAPGVPIELHADKIFMGGSNTSKCYFKANSDTDDGVTDYILVNSNNPIDAMTIDSDGNNDTVTKIRVVKGGTTLTATLGNIAELSLGSRLNPASDARVTVSPSSFTIADVKLDSGILLNKRTTTRGLQNGGQWTQETNGITRLALTAGKNIYNTDAVMTLADLYGGELDLTQSGHKKTITLAQKHNSKAVLKKDDGDLHTVTLEDMTGGN